MKPTRTIQTLLAVLPVITAGLYLVGLCFHQGYLDAFGIDDSLFPLASDKALFTGFLSLAMLTFPAAVYIVVAIGIFMILVIVVAVLSSTSRVQVIVTHIQGWFAQRRPKLDPIAPAADNLIDRSMAVHAYVTGFLLVILLLFVIAIISTKSGAKQAEREIADFQKGKGISAQVSSSQAPQGYLGKLVICGDKYCAFWSSKGAFILKHEAIDSIVTHKPA